MVNLNISDRKQDHIDLAKVSQTTKGQIDERFNYEPMLSADPAKIKDTPFTFFNNRMRFPIWISSMTGGTGKALSINKMLAKAANKYGLAMGLGSCRPILNNKEKYFDDFNLRPILGDKTPFYGNIGVAQLEELRVSGEYERIIELIEILKLDGLFVHINPLQEYYQPEGDRLQFSPLSTLCDFLSKTKLKNIIVKEVGHGFGPKSLEALVELPISGIEFGAFGGTNFSKIEELRRNNTEQFQHDNALMMVGHPYIEMIENLNKIMKIKGNNFINKTFIVSGGIRSYLDGFYSCQKLESENVFYGMAWPFMEAALKGEDSLDEFIKNHLNGLLMAQSYLTLKE